MAHFITAFTPTRVSSFIESIQPDLLLSPISTLLKLDIGYAFAGYLFGVPYQLVGGEVMSLLMMEISSSSGARNSLPKVDLPLSEKLIMMLSVAGLLMEEGAEPIHDLGSKKNGESGDHEVSDNGGFCLKGGVKGDECNRTDEIQPQRKRLGHH